MKIKVGSKIIFDGEVRPYRVRACDKRYLICTKPFNLKHTVIYTIVDLKLKIRGTENTVFCMGFEKDQDCVDALLRLASGDSEVSHRNRVVLKIKSYES
jgi:hypothetical protein